MTDGQTRIYNEAQIVVGTFLGSPLAGGWLMAKNFSIFGEKSRARNTWITAILACMVVFGIILFVPGADKISGAGITAAYVVIAHRLVKHYQGTRIAEHRKSMQPFFSWWRAIGISLAAVVICVVLILGLAQISYSMETASLRSNAYGTTGNQVHFKQGHVTESETAQIAEALKKSGFFTDDDQKAVFLETIPGGYEVKIPCNPEYKSDPGMIKFFAQLRAAVQLQYPDKKIVFLLFVDTVDNVIKRLE